MSFEYGGPTDSQSFSKPIEFPRKKHYSLRIRIGYRFYYFARVFFAKKKFLRNLLNITWFLQRVTQEQTYYSSEELNKLSEILRPRNVSSILDSTFSGQRVLDFGGGTGSVTHALLENGNKVVYLDHSPEACKSAQKRFAHNQNFTLMLPHNFKGQPEKSFDLIVLSHVLEHVEDRKSLLTEMKSKARKIHIEVPDFSSDPLNYVRSILSLPVHKDDDHVVEFTRESLMELIHGVDLQIEKLEVRDGCIVALCICS
jgi:SAM-dependent methyltransferase